MAKVQIKSEKLTPFGGHLLEEFFQSWSNLTPCFHLLSTIHLVRDAAVLSAINTARLSVGFYPTVSRHDNARASSSLLIWLNETVR